MTDLWVCEECGAGWNPFPDRPNQCRRCGNRTRLPNAPWPNPMWMHHGEEVEAMDATVAATSRLGELGVPFTALRDVWTWINDRWPGWNGE